MFKLRYPFYIQECDILFFMNTTSFSWTKSLLQWFEKNKRPLPFRLTKDPYAVWISEIMAQQTQIDTLLPYYNRFVESFPHVQALAAAEEDLLLKHWEGLGYYNRAKNLHRAAKIIVTEWHGFIPDNYKDLLKLPGIGPYTAAAIASICFNEKIAAVDGNVLRVFSRLTNSFDDIGEQATKRQIQHALSQCMPDEPGDFNEAMMELGALICLPTNPYCLLCPIREHCSALETGHVHLLPVKKKKIKRKTLAMEACLVEDTKGQLLIEKRPDKGLLSGLWGFPIVEKNQGIGNYLQKTYKYTEPLCLIGKTKHVFTHITWEIDLYIIKQVQHDGDKGVFISPKNILSDFALPTAFKKMLRFYNSSSRKNTPYK